MGLIFGVDFSFVVALFLFTAMICKWKFVFFLWMETFLSIKMIYTWNFYSILFVNVKGIVINLYRTIGFGKSHCFYCKKKIVLSQVGSGFIC